MKKSQKRQIVTDVTEEPKSKKIKKAKKQEDKPHNPETDLPQQDKTINKAGEMQKQMQKKKKKKLLGNKKQNGEWSVETNEQSNTLISEDSEKVGEEINAEKADSTLSSDCDKEEEINKVENNEMENVEKENLIMTKKEKKLKKKQKQLENELKSNMDSNKEKKKKMKKGTKSDSENIQNGTDNSEKSKEKTDSDAEEVKPGVNDELIYKLLGQKPEKIATLNEFQKRLIKLSLIKSDESDELTEDQKNTLLEVKRKHSKVFKQAVNRGYKKGALMNTIDKSSRSKKFFND